MTIYVDEPRPYANPPLPGDWCHMGTDGDLEELHQFAKSIGLEREWLHVHRRSRYILPHYDLTETKRRKAIEAGAVSVTSGEFLEICRMEASQ